MLELGSGGRPGGCDEPDVALGAVGILYSSLKMLSLSLLLHFLLNTLNQNQHWTGWYLNLSLVT